MHGAVVAPLKRGVATEPARQVFIRHKGARRHDSTIDRSKSTVRREKHETLRANICLIRNAGRISDRADRPGKRSCVWQLGQLRRYQRHRRDRQRLRDRASRHHQKPDQRRLRIESKFRHALSWRRRALRSADHRRSVRWRWHGDRREGDLPGQLWQVAPGAPEQTFEAPPTPSTRPGKVAGSLAMSATPMSHATTSASARSVHQAAPPTVG